MRGERGPAYTASMPDDSSTDAGISPSPASHAGSAGAKRTLPRRQAKTSAARDWLVPALLILLSLVPVAAGAFRLVGLSGGEADTAASARYFADPVPAVLHIVSASVFCVVGAFQFSPGLRRRKARWHRSAGRLLAPLGLLAALSGLWLTQFYPPAEHDGMTLYVMRLILGSVMAACIGMSLLAIRRRDYRAHGSWMTRGYAIGIGAGTQVLTHVPWMLLGLPFTEHSRALLMGAGWVINIVVAEWVIHRTSGARTARPSASLTST